jgi:hypothetical protein
VKQCATNLVSRTIIRTALQVAPKVKQEFAAKEKAQATRKAMDKAKPPQQRLAAKKAKAA